MENLFQHSSSTFDFPRRQGACDPKSWGNITEVGLAERKPTERTDYVALCEHEASRRFRISSTVIVEVVGSSMIGGDHE